jgi:hypothetical protein
MAGHRLLNTVLIMSLEKIGKQHERI